MVIHEFSRDGLTFRVRDRGPEQGQPVVLLHGFPQDSTCWQRLEPLLHAAGRRTLAPDQRGYSPAARPRERAAYRVNELVADVVALLDTAGLAQGHVVGHDWGGGVAWELAARHPDRVARLTVLSTPHPGALSWALRHDPEQRRMSWYMAAFTLPWLPERYLAARMFPVLRRSGMPPLDAARYAQRFASPAELAGPLAWYRALSLPTQRPHPPPVAVPTRYLWGAQDPTLGRVAAERSVRQVSGPYRFVELAAGHWLPEVHADQVAAAVLAEPPT